MQGSKKCTTCGRTVYGYGDICSSCLLKPSREITIGQVSNKIAEEKKEVEVMPNHESRTCSDCSTVFVPAGQNQKRCAPCSEKNKTEMKKVYMARYNARKKGEPLPPKVKPQVFAEQEQAPKSEQTPTPQPKPDGQGSFVSIGKKEYPIQSFTFENGGFSPKSITIEIGSLKITISQ